MPIRHGGLRGAVRQSVSRPALGCVLRRHLHQSIRCRWQDPVEYGPSHFVLLEECFTQVTYLVGYFVADEFATFDAGSLPTGRSLFNSTIMG